MYQYMVNCFYFAMGTICLSVALMVMAGIARGIVQNINQNKKG